MNFHPMLLGHYIFNYVGATIRWIYGSIWRTILNKPKFTYNEYVYGPKKSNNYFDKLGHQMNNKIIAMVFMGGIIIILMN